MFIDMSEQQQVLQTFDPKNLQGLIAQETERRSTLRAFIAQHLIEGVDYGTIQIGGRASKPCLFKPGAEKFCSLLQLRAEFVKDEETLSMMGDTTRDVIAYVCRLVHVSSGNLIAEGRGACALKEKQGSVNTTVKIAEKRAQIDAVLRLGFSESFTQDLEDMTVPAVAATHVTAAPIESLEETESKKRILKLLEDLGHHPERYSAVANKQKVKSLTQLEPNAVNYEEIIERLRFLVEERQLQARQ